MSDYRPYLDTIEPRRDALLERLTAWAGINSGSHNLAGLEAMRRELETAFAPLGAVTETLDLSPMQAVDDQGRAHDLPLGKALRLRKHRPEARMRIFLGGHMDTVFGPDHEFQSCRWQDDATLNGPGVADLKGGLLVMLTALETLEQSPWAGQLAWEVLINPDEEIGSPGSAPLLEAAARRNDLGLVFEPALADGTLAGARKGSGNFTVVARGRAAHAGREHHRGRNAVVALAGFVQALDALNGQRPGVTVNPARVLGGGAVNIVPDTALCRFNVRMEDPEEQIWLDQRLRELIEQGNQADGIVLSLHGGFTRPPKRLSADTQRLFEQVRACGRDLDLEIAWQPTGGCCDGNNLAAAGLPNVDTLGVRGGAIHSADEFMDAASLTERARLSALLLMKLASGELHWPTGGTP